MGCQVCRARKVKCDGRPGGCLACARLELACDLAGYANARGRRPALSKAKRTYRSCASCRAAKTKCNGEHPVCSRCRTRSIQCAYGTTAGPIWTRVLRPGAQARPETRVASRDSLSEIIPETVLETVQATVSETPHAPYTPNTPEAAMPMIPSAHDGGNERALSWLYAAQLPESPVLLRRAVDHYFSNVHPLRCLAFVHKPTLMQQLETWGDGKKCPARDSDDMALLQIICAHGAKFCALEYSETVAVLSAPRIQAAGHEWAKAAEQTLMTNYARITVPSLMTAVLLYDYRYRLGDFAHALMMSGLTTRMAHALQLNREHEPGAQEPHSVHVDSRTDDGHGEGQPGEGETGRGTSSMATELSSCERESRRRLMWACYVIDVWTGSGVDQLTLLREEDLHIQLPVTERDFLFQRPRVTASLASLDQMLKERPESTGLMAAYIRLVSLWKRVARYVKHLDTAALPWQPGSEFSVLDDALRTWRRQLTPYLEFSTDSMYTRLASSQLGALAVLHCTYYNAMLDLYRIAMPELFSLRHAFSFPPEQADMLRRLQSCSYHHACHMATVFEKTAAQGARHLVDSMMPMFAYNSSRVMLYYLVRLHDPARADTPTLIQQTIKHVQSNNHALQLAATMMPLSEPLLDTSRRWLQKLQSGLHRQQEGVAVAALYGMAVDHDGQVPITGRSTDTADTIHVITETPDTAGATDAAIDTPDTPDNVLHPLSLYRLARKTLSDKTHAEPSSWASYAGGGLPPLRDVVMDDGYRVNGQGPSTLLERPSPSGSVVAMPLPTPLPAAMVSTPAATAADADNEPPVPASALAPPPLAAPSSTAWITWESAFDDLAMGLNVLQDEPHWDMHGFDHMHGGCGLFDNGLAGWPEIRKG